MFLFFKRYWAALLWTGVIAWVCFSPPGDIPSGLFAILSKIPYFDKIVHFSIFGIYSFLLAVCRYRDYSSLLYTLVYSFLLSFCYAALTEIVQWKFITGRTGDPADLAADLIGACCGLIAAVMFIRRRKRKA